MLLRYVLDVVKQLQRVLYSKPSLVVDDLRPLRVASSQNCHAIDQYLARLRLLHYHTELLPGALVSKLWDELLEEMTDACCHVRNREIGRQFHLSHRAT